EKNPFFARASVKAVTVRICLASPAHRTAGGGTPGDAGLTSTAARRIFIAIDPLQGIQAS
ncbi:hypothetical protein, partial [Arenimonas malthae]|uniref:hypothetical protein n=1 Tax=Arenimonas malthae TaxID=354197 RepID=UPI001B80D1CC